MADNIQVDVSEDFTRMWVNVNGICRARFSTVSGYEIYTSEGFMHTYGTSCDRDAYEVFRDEVKCLYGVALDEDALDIDDIGGNT